MWRPTSPLYRGTDTELTMKLTTFWFFCNRPTVGALIGLGSDLAAATAVAKPGDEQSPAAGQSASQEPVSCSGTGRATHALEPCPPTSDATTSDDLLYGAPTYCKPADHIDKGEYASTDAHMSPFLEYLLLRIVQATDKGTKEAGKVSAAPMRLEGGNTRVVFHLGIELQKLEATFNYESADVAPLASLSVQVCTLLLAPKTDVLPVEVCEAPGGHCRLRDTMSV